MTETALETGLRRNAPPLPARLRSATLARCVERAAAQQRRDRNQLRLVYALASVCALQMLASNQLDAQRLALVSGPGGTSCLIMDASPSMPDLPQRMRARTRYIASLIARPSDILNRPQPA